MLTEVECERLQGFPNDFTRYGIINGEVREISRANRYAMLGNCYIHACRYDMCNRLF